MKECAEAYTCANCGSTFLRGWSDEEAETEKTRNFPAEVAAEEEFVLVCDDCYHPFLARVQGVAD